MRVADHTLRELRKHGEWRELEDEVDGGPTVAQSAKSKTHKRGPCVVGREALMKTLPGKSQVPLVPFHGV